MQNKPADAPLNELQGHSCVHHWLLGPLDGQSYPATCSKCGQARTFPANLDNAWKDKNWSETPVMRWYGWHEWRDERSWG